MDGSKSRGSRCGSVRRFVGSLTNQNSAMREIQDICSMKPRFRNANLLITHVLDQCVKLLAVLHISGAQGRSVDLSVEIATGRRRMVDIISTPVHLTVAQYDT